MRQQDKSKTWMDQESARAVQLAKNGPGAQTCMVLLSLSLAIEII